jgi:hypothetical protein
MQPQRMILPIPMAGGVDRRSDRRHVKPPKCLALENVRFTGPGTIQKRFGCDALGTTYSSVSGTTRSTAAIAGGHSLFSVGDRLYTMAGERVLSWNEATDVWSLHGIMPLVDVSMTDHLNLRTNEGSGYTQDVCRTSDGLICVIGDRTATPGILVVKVLDEITGDAYTFSLSGNDVTNARVVACGATIMLFYADGSPTRTLYLKTITRAQLPTLATNTLASTTAAVGTCAEYPANSAAGRVRYDVVEYSASKVLVAWVDDGGTFDIQHAYVDTAGALTSTGADTPAAQPDAVCLSVASNGSWAKAWIYGNLNVALIVFGRLYDSASAALTVATQIDSNTDAAVSATALSITTIWISTTQIYALWSVHGRTRYGTLTTAAAATAGLFAWNAALQSRMWLHGGQAFALLGPQAILGTSQEPKAAVLFRVGTLGTGAVSYPQDAQVATVCGNFLPGEIDIVSSGRLCHVPAGSASHRFLFAAADRLLTLEFQGSVTTGQAQAFRHGNTAFVPSAQLWQIDSEGIHESGFVTYPYASLASFAGGAMTSGATYSYRVYWEWENAAGELERSTSVAWQITLGGADTRVTITVNTTPFTLRTSALGLRDVRAVAYRANPGSTVYRKVGSGTLNDMTARTITIGDTNADSAILDDPVDYLSDGEVDIVAPPAHRVATVCGGRAFLSGFARNGDLVWFSRLRFEDRPLDFSDLNTFLVQPGDGPITALGALGDSLIVFRRRQLYVVGGEGPGNTGAGGSFTASRLLSDELGCANPASIVNGPAGLYFQSAKGIYLLDAAGALSYVGADVQDLVALGDITSAVLVEDAREIRFTLAAATKMLVYHYDIGAWSTRSYPAQYGACLWRGTYVGIDSAVGGIYKEVADQYHDATAAYTMALETAWIRPGSLIQGGDRLKTLLFAGTWRDGHKSRVKWHFDYSDNVADTVNWTPTVSAATANYQFEARPSRQRVQAFKVRLEDVADGVDPLRDSFSLSELAVELAVRGHLADLPVTGRAT